MEELYSIFKQSAGISTDTRTIAKNSLFFALKGENFDANTMVDLALESGAIHVVTSNKAYASNPKATVVEDTLATLQQLAAYHRQQLDIPIVGITGTNGKTTTKELISSVLRRKYKVFATKGNLNNHIGVPLSLLSITDDDDMAVIEMGASHPGEIRDLSAIVRPTCGLITNVGIAHIQGFGSFEGVKRTKGELYAQLKSTHGTIFINAGNENLVGMLGDYDRCISYGTDSEQNYVDGHLTEMTETLNFEWRVNNGLYRTVQTNLTGAYNLENALAAGTVGSFFDVPETEICVALSEYKPTNSRSQIVVTERNKVIVDAYNANPSSMNASVDNFAQLNGEHKVVILGAMRELGEQQTPQHLALLEKLQKLGFELVMLVGDEFAEFKQLFSNFRFYSVVDEVIDEAKALNGKYILVKGSNSNHLGKLVEYL
ncbi:MAG: UDP-N-acetylmuramoyl-tripeptide--D-alanyl-D-alanine ligase [Bacteroidales bacterium]|nr:UDP-N-acetylmuramoyl-tripeptide--D-alanyl-D-alanine ligase [Bacteroidales bacterium]